MQTYCLDCKNALIIYVQNKKNMKNEEIKGESKWADCMASFIVF